MLLTAMRLLFGMSVVDESGEAVAGAQVAVKRPVRRLPRSIFATVSLSF